MGKRETAWLGVALLVLLLPVRAEGRFINLGGSLDWTYGETKTEQHNATQETTFFQQRYNLHNFGEIFNPRIGTMLLNGTYLQQDTDTDGLQGDQDFHFDDYAVHMNLLPYVSPVSLYYQRMNRTNEIDPFGAQAALKVKDRVTTLGGSWSLSSPRLPRIAVSYNQSELESPDDANRLPNTINRFLNLESSGQFRETTLVGRYQFNEADIADFGQASSSRVRGNAFNLSTESRPAPALILTTFTRVANRSGGQASGVTFAQERGFGGSLSYTPSVKWDTHARINFTETPGSTGGRDLKQQNAFWSGSYRPTEELDMVMSARYFRFDISEAETTSPYFDYSLNYRPFFGFSSGFGASYGMTETKGGGAEVSTDYLRYRGNADYTRALEYIRYSTSYAVSHGVSDTDGQGESKDIMHTLTLSVENTRIRYVHVTLGYTFNDLDRSHTGGDSQVQDVGDQLSHLFQVNADSSYFRGLLLESDSLLLQSTASWTKIEGFGAAGENFLLDGRGNYYFLPGAVLSAGYTRQDYPGGFYADTDTFYEELSWSFFIGDTSFSFGARANQERTEGGGNNSLDRDTIQTTGSMTYRIGKFLLSADGQWGKDTSKSTTDVDFENQSFFVRASRSF
ncbi:MAG: hypothetical protein ACE5F7_07980 [Nitrospiria bacterium]